MGGVEAETAWPHSEMLWFPSPWDGRSEGAASSRQGEQTVVQPQGQGCCFQAQGTARASGRAVLGLGIGAHSQSLRRAGEEAMAGWAGLRGDFGNPDRRSII